ncbi:peptidylprolyl isomerase [Haliangium ochraceum]|nr:peptidylprolyl isomerase [Haliangium ochraceum]
MTQASKSRTPMPRARSSARALLLAAVACAGLATPALAQQLQGDKGPAVGGGEKRATRTALVLDRVAAVVNDSVILTSELDARLAPLTAGLANINDERERARRGEQLRSQQLDEMISEELVVQEARKSKLNVDDKEVSAALAEIKQQNGLDDTQLAAALAQQGYSMQAYRKEVERQLLHRRAINMLVRPRVTVTDEDVRVRYDTMSRRSAAVSKVRLKHALLSLPPNPSNELLAEAKSKAAAIVEAVRGGASFDDQARQYSDDINTRDSGGDLGWIERGSIATEWEVIVFSMEEGEVRGPVSGPGGLHVFYVEELAKSDLEEFDAVKEQLQSEIYREEMDKEITAWLQELRDKAFIDRKI